jgi:hypothetical protein
MSPAFWPCAVVTAVSAFVSLGFSVAALSPSGKSEGTEGTSAMYAFSRSLALAATCAVVLVAQLDAWLAAAALTMVLVQAADAVIGGLRHDRLKTVGPALTAVVNLIALVWFLR